MIFYKFLIIIHNCFIYNLKLKIMTENKDEEEIKSKIMLVDKQINEDLSLIPEYKLL